MNAEITDGICKRRIDVDGRLRYGSKMASNAIRMAFEMTESHLFIIFQFEWRWQFQKFYRHQHSALMNNRNWHPHSENGIVTDVDFADNSSSAA